jgi:hypothetical protein
VTGVRCQATVGTPQFYAAAARSAAARTVEAFSACPFIGATLAVRDFGFKLSAEQPSDDGARELLGTRAVTRRLEEQIEEAGSVFPGH